MEKEGKVFKVFVDGKVVYDGLKITTELDKFWEDLKEYF